MRSLPVPLVYATTATMGGIAFVHWWPLPVQPSFSAASGHRLYGRAWCRLFPQPLLVAVRGHRVIGAASGHMRPPPYRPYHLCI
ncbi:hypothetical protein BHE74_00035426 [Ensete ventricosum]|nr:hypothetical protein GW17_00041893 [Ensete ventricosum]RWW57761.1 hypothetical protein BHE74_00035426 [Ensete ventricosum]RZR94893.1 hypothetical protein BHM03_00023665 [Ensete ventricosum]